MTSKVVRWLRHICWYLDDRIIDALDWIAAWVPEKKPYYPPAPMQMPEPEHVGFSFCGVSFQPADPVSIDAQMTNDLMKQIASKRMFEIRY